MKTVEEIYQEMLSCFEEKSGVEAAESCDLAVRLYALAAQVYALYVQADWVNRQAFPQTAEGECLDRHAEMRGLERKVAVAAEGTVRFLASAALETDRTIPAGTVCMTSGLVRFETVKDGVLLAGNVAVDVPVRAVEPGKAGNVNASAITYMAVAPVGIYGCTNPKACGGGTDREGDEALRERVLDTFRRLPNGANAAFYESEALSFDQVAAASVISRPRGVGTVDVVVATEAGLPGEDLLAELTTYFLQRREIAVDVQVRAPRTSTVNVTVRVAPRAGWSFESVAASVKTAIQGWFTGKRLGQDVLRAALGDLIYSCDGVANYTITSPANDVTVAADVLPVLGSLTVEELT